MQSTIDVSRHGDGTLQCIVHRKGKELHRDPAEGPAAEWFHPNGSLARREFWFEDQLHREIEDGPAVVVAESGGNILYQEFWVHGQQEQE